MGAALRLSSRDGPHNRIPLVPQPLSPAPCRAKTFQHPTRDAKTWVERPIASPCCRGDESSEPTPQVSRQEPQHAKVAGAQMFHVEGSLLLPVTEVTRLHIFWRAPLSMPDDELRFVAKT